jgi:nicotinamide riboside kinase
MKRIGFAGVPGAGKSTLARAVSALCRNSKFSKVELVSEYARRHIFKYGKIESLQEQYRITEKQINWEDSVHYDSTDLLVTDSTIFLGFLYALSLRNNSNVKDTMYMDDFYKLLNKSNINYRYDIIFFLPPILKPVEDGVRPKLHFDENWRKEASYNIEFIFKLFPPKNFISLNEVELDKRIEECLMHIKNIL